MLRWMFGTHLAMAGTLGVPLAGTVAFAAKAVAAALGGDDDELFDPNVAWRNCLADNLGNDIGLLVAKGLPAYAGADLSKRMGLGDVASPVPFLQHRADDDGTAAGFNAGLMLALVLVLVVVVIAVLFFAGAFDGDDDDDVENPVEDTDVDIDADADVEQAGSRGHRTGSEPPDPGRPGDGVLLEDRPPERHGRRLTVFEVAQ